MQFLDIHTHQEGKDAGVRQILSVSLTGDTRITFPEDQELSLGLHPWFATMEHLEHDYLKLAEAATGMQVKLIGECGLDRLRGESLDNQLIILRKQLRLANALHKPVILHCVRCFGELIALQKEMKVSVPLIVHGFNKHEELGRQLLDNGFYLSFGKAILNPDSGAAALLKHTDMFFLETDDSDYHIREIYQAAANLKNCTVEEMKALIFANWKKIKFT
ncbi:MAG: TatD family hydrolase [Candidatus Pedobacter colombiensis]|uniref:TatD family hydrolase n=1 Tax=Candidatus Pedobacter colombiensis TaxID=3121371 RepID=A0AAJ5W8L2_9SPHI|nr:TatD family hydrolase [Pedobacter sp.]WEK19198.1 MAG: TatD family hydrolase [Pedobacter sp.]